ncbi:MAG: ABC transporter ATP-binding protein [Nitrosomonadaceae bacterium]
MRIGILKHILEFFEISKTFSCGRFRSKLIHALKNVSLAVAENEIFCLIGPNGAGKTTLIRLLLGFTHPTSGRSELFGRRNSDRFSKSLLGYMPENARYPLRLTVGQFLSYWGKFSGIPSRELANKVGDLLEFVSLKDRVKSQIRELSKGMQARLGLAQALINDPKLLILDEPNDSLDPLGRIEFRDLLKQLKASGKTVFMNSHLLSEVERISDRVGVLNSGELLKVEHTRNVLRASEEYEVMFTCSSETSISELKHSFNVRDDGEIYSIVVRNSQELEKLMKELSDKEILIRSVNQRKQSIEEFFLSLTKA